ncbi:hypothetical protein GCM10009665_01490 [Kitasatospora nipponensis]|uniref:LysM domain-containing protein n=1 Tax=Kitasatospora nipponensis TaxID=258049 RepID=A0ABN1VKL3_9ACTN
MTATVERLGHFLRAIGAVTTLAGLLVGLPYALLGWGEPFRPRQLPDLDEFTAWASSPLSAMLLLQLLYCLCWLLWAYLLLQVLREIRWHAAHFGTLLHEPGTEALAAAARRTVAGLLVGAVVLAIATSLRSTAIARPAAIPASWSTPIAATAPAAPVQAVRPAARAAQVVAGPSAPSTETCVVQPGDTLWDLADRHLDNPLRWREIYELNKLRHQSDGAQFSDPDRITPGWTLLLPGPDPRPVTTAVPPPVPAVPTPTPATPSASMPPSPTASGSAAATPAPAAPEHADADHAASGRQATGESGIQLPDGAGYLAVSVGIALSAAAVRRTLRRRRDYRPSEFAGRHPAQHPEETPLVAALRGAARHHLATESGIPPGDLPLAARGGRQLGLLDLLTSRRHTTLALTGPGADDAARALLATAVTVPGRVRLLVARTEVTRLVPGLADRGLPLCHLVTDSEAALVALEEECLRRTRQRRDEPGSAEAQPDRLVLLASHDARLHVRLRTVLEAGRELGFAAILLADATSPPTDSVVCHVQLDGQATIGGQRSDDTLRFYHLPVSSADILLRLVPEEGGRSLMEVLSTDGSSFPPTREAGMSIPSPDPSGEIIESEVGGELAGQSEGALRSEEPQQPTRPVAARVGPQQVSSTVVAEPVTTTVAPTLPINISLLGPLATTVRGQLVTRGVNGFAGELLAYLATHPAGSTKEAILDAVWPEKDPATTGTEAFHTAKKSIRTALRSALGAGTSLAVLLQTNGLWRLDPVLADSDLDHFRAAVHRASGATDPAERVAGHRRTVELYRGELCEGMDHPWLTAPREEARRRVLNALGALAANADDPEETLGLLERALEHDPYNEQLHLRLARQHLALGRADAVRRTQERLRGRLAEIEERPTQATTRAFQDLLRPATARPAPTRRPPLRPGGSGPARLGGPGPAAPASR